MDSVDKRLLEILADDARKPIKRIASDAGVSREVADYRIKKLEKKVIGGYRARLNFAKFTHSSHFMLIQFKKLKEFKFLHFLRSVKYPHWIGRAFGEFDVLLSFSIKEQKELNKQIRTILKYFENNVKKYKVLTLTEELFDSSLYSKKKLSSFAGVKEIKLDKKDLQILNILSENCRTSNKEIGRKVKLTSEAVNYRIKRLEENKVILGYRTIFNYEEQYEVLLEANNVDKEILQDKRIIQASQTSNGLLLNIVANKVEFYKVMKEIRNEIEIESFEIMNMTELSNNNFTISD